MKSFASRYCSIKDFRSKLTATNFYNDIRGSDRNYFFWKYENYLRQREQPVASPMPVEALLTRDRRTRLSIEHIIPRSPEDSNVVEDEAIWPEIIMEEDGEYYWYIVTGDFEDRWLHSIGNLTIDPISANASKSNASFDVKNQKHFKKAPLKTQNELVDFINPETGRWDGVSVQQRQEKLIGFALEEWDPENV